MEGLIGEAERRPSAGFWLRGGAFCLDFVVLAFALILVNLAVFRVVPPGVTAFAGHVLYFGLLPVLWDGRTLGKAAAAVRIVGRDDGPLTYQQGVFRALGYYLSGLPLLLGYVAAAFTPDKRALHDYVAGTRVVRDSDIGLLRWVPLLLAMPLTAGLFAFPVVYRYSQAKKAADRIPVTFGTPEDHAEVRATPELEKTRWALTPLRLGVMSYKKANGGAIPPDLDALVSTGQLRQVSQTRTGVHAPSAEAVLYDARVCAGGGVGGAGLKDTGAWGYVADPEAPCAGKVFVDCTHDALPGAPWYAQ
jgi:uncharacterized RDD family membrane protein YckC